MFPCAIRGLRLLKNQRTVCLPKRRIHPSELCNCPFQCSESLFYFLLVSWWRQWLAKPSSVRYHWPKKNNFWITDFDRVCFMTAQLLSENEKSAYFFFFTAVVCSQTWLTLCVFHRTFPCGVCFLWGLGVPVTVLDGGHHRNASVDCGSRGRPRQMSLAWS